jgi:hypothetical protein
MLRMHIENWLFAGDPKCSLATAWPVEDVNAAAEAILWRDRFNHNFIDSDQEERDFSYITQITRTTNFVVMRRFCGKELVWPCFRHWFCHLLATNGWELEDLKQLHVIWHTALGCTVILELQKTIERTIGVLGMENIELTWHSMYIKSNCKSIWYKLCLG